MFDSVDIVSTIKCILEKDAFGLLMLFLLLVFECGEL